MSPGWIFLISLVVLFLGVWWAVGDEYGQNGGEMGGVMALFALANLILTACGFWTPDPPPKPGSPEAAKVVAEKAAENKRAAIDARLRAGEVIEVNTAPDGTKLWMTLNPDGEKVYFTADRVQRQSD